MNYCCLIYGCLLGESWSLCDTHSEAASEVGGDWELVSMEAIGQEIQQMNITADKPNIKFSYADIVKKQTLNIQSIQRAMPKKQLKKAWTPVFQVKVVSLLDRPYVEEKSYDYGFNDDIYDGEAYDYVKSFGAVARSNMFAANVAYTKQKAAGVICEGNRSKSVK